MSGNTALALALALASITPSALHAQPVTLALVKDFDLQPCVPDQPEPITHAFAVTAQGLYFLVSPPFLTSGSIQYIVKTDFNGTCTGTIALPEVVSRLWFSVNSDLSFSVLKQRNGMNVERLELDSRGQVISRVHLEKAVDDMTSAGNQWIGVSNTGSVDAYNREGAVVKTFLPAPQEHVHQKLLLAPLSDTLVMLIRRRTGKADLFDLAAGTDKEVSIAPDDFAAALSTYTNPKQAVVVFSATSDKSGYAFLSLSGIKAADGGSIIKVDQTGNVIQHYRCVLPTRRIYADGWNREGFMFPSLIRTFGNQLYISDNHGVVGKYILP